MDPLTQQTMDLVKQAQSGPSLQLRKAGISQGLGLVGYSLEPAAKLLYPVLTPLRNSIPRVGMLNGVAGTAEHWKAITQINSQNVRAGVSEGNRNAPISFTEVDRIAAYVGIGMENFVTFESDYAGRGFEDVKALAVLAELQALMIAEEQIILNGNNSLLLGTTPTPAGTPATTGGTIADGTTNFLYCVALTYWGINGNGGAQNPVPSTGVLLPTITRTNADASTDTFGGGVAKISAASSAITTTGGGTSSIAATVAAVKGAFGYAWFLGVTAGAANAFLVAITSLPSVTITAAATSTYAANSTGLSTDNSTCALEFDGLISSSLQLNGYYKSLASATLTADGYGGVVEIDAMLKSLWDNFRISPQVLWVDSQCARDITKKVASGTTNPSYRINLENTLNSLGNVVAGSLVTTYLNKYGLNGAQSLDIRLHPNMPTGTIYADLTQNPYPNSRVATPRRIRTRQDYYQVEWPLRTRKYEYGVYSDEMLQMYIGFGTGLITDIAAG